MTGEIKNTYLKACHVIEELQEMYWFLESDPETRKKLTDADREIIKSVDCLYAAITAENTDFQSGRRKDD